MYANTKSMPDALLDPTRKNRTKRRNRTLIALAMLLVVGYLYATPAAIFAIKLYQKHISPYNHHRCPYGLLHGGETCSDYGKHAIQQRGLLWGLWMLRGRFEQCHEAQIVLQKNPGVAKAGFCCYSCGDDEIHSCEW